MTSLLPIRSMRAGAAALILGLAAAGQAAADPANLLAHGSFENPDIVATGSYQLFNTDSTGITGWTVIGGQVQLTPDTYLGLKAADGRQWIDMTGIVGYDKGLRSDAIAVQPGLTYAIGFDLGNYLPFGASTLGLSVNGSAEQTFTNPSLSSTATAPMNWQHQSLLWTADSSSLSLSFLGRANGGASNNLGIGLDNVSVSVTAVPEPASLALMLAGAGLLAWRTRRQA